MSVCTPAQGPRTALTNAGDLTAYCAFYRPQQVQPNSRTYTRAPRRNTQSKLISPVINFEKLLYSLGDGSGVTTQICTVVPNTVHNFVTFFSS